MLPRIYNFKKKNFLIKVVKNFWSCNFIKNKFLIIHVCLFSNKFIIKKAVEFIFGVKVLNVNTLIKKYFLYKNKNLFKILRKKKAFIKYI